MEKSFGIFYGLFIGNLEFDHDSEAYMYLGQGRFSIITLFFKTYLEKHKIRSNKSLDNMTIDQHDP